MNMIMTAVFPDGSWLKGVRKWYWFFVEIGTHHFRVTETSSDLAHLIGKKVGVPINSVKYFVMDKGLMS